MTFSEDELRILNEGADPADALGIFLMKNLSDILIEELGLGWTHNEDVIIKRFERYDYAIYATCSIT